MQVTVPAALVMSSSISLLNVTSLWRVACVKW